MYLIFNRERGGVYSAGAANRVHNGSGGVLAVGQLLVTGARGHTGGRLTRGGGRVHACVAPALCGGGAGARHGGLAVTGAATAAARAASYTPARRAAPLSRRWRLSQPALRSASASTPSCLLTGVPRALLSCA